MTGRFKTDAGALLWRSRQGFEQLNDDLLKIAILTGGKEMDPREIARPIIRRQKAALAHGACTEFDAISLVSLWFRDKVAR